MSLVRKVRKPTSAQVAGALAAGQQATGVVSDLMNALFPARPQRLANRAIRRQARFEDRRMRRNKRRGLPVANAQTVTAQGSGATVNNRGRDLVPPADKDLLRSRLSAGSSSGMIISANPAYLLGTKIAAVAAAHMSYLPILMRIEYVPKVPTTTAGTITIGTAWDNEGVRSRASLLTSPGGITGQVYAPLVTTIPMGERLRYKNYDMAGGINDTTNPFTVFVDLENYTGSDMPGDIFIDYQYRLLNPTGAGRLFAVDDSTISVAANTKCDCISYDGWDDYPAGTVLHGAQGATAFEWTVNGAVVDPPEELSVRRFVQRQGVVAVTPTYSIEISSISGEPPTWVDDLTSYLSGAVNAVDVMLIGSGSSQILTQSWWQVNSSSPVKPSGSGYVFDGTASCIVGFIGEDGSYIRREYNKNFETPDVLVGERVEFGPARLVSRVGRIRRRT